jgi:deaminated glutathione amidase
MSRTLRTAVVQLNSGDQLEANLARASTLVQVAQAQGAELVVLPENFAFFGGAGERRRIAESLQGEAGPIRRTLSELAQRLHVTILAGGWPEKSEAPDRPHNSATLYGSDGGVVANYRKIHLFDVTLPDGTRYAESVGVEAGRDLVCAPVGAFRVGLSICYDLRFPELYRGLVDLGADVLLIPAAFTLETGRDHFRLLLRARAVESQCWVVAANQWGRHPMGRTTYGHSMIIDPWGTVVAEASAREGVVVADIDGDLLDQTRERLPCLRHRRL